MTAEQMFKELGYKADSFNQFGGMIVYYYVLKYNANVRFIVKFDCNDEYYTCYCQIKNPLDNSVLIEKQEKVDASLHQAITKQMEELKWL